jgi:hypothetical protein
MIYICFSLLAFIVTIIIHLLFCRILLVFGKKSIKSLGIFIVCLIFYISFLHVMNKSVFFSQKGLWYIPLPWVSVVFYILLLLFYFIYFMSTFSGEESPSLKLYSLLKNGQQLSLSQIVHEFPKVEMIDMRLRSLESGKFIMQKKNNFTVLKRGKILAGIFSWYRSLLDWKSSG